ncbi:MAG: AraC family transcriptional regulator [Bacteroidota bacterium]
MFRFHQQFDLCGKKTFEKAIIDQDFRVVYQMSNEACFFYIHEGESRMYSANETVKLTAQEGVVMQCGNYIADMLSTSEVGCCEAVAVHLYPEVIKMIYENEIPDLLVTLNNIKPIKVEKFQSSQLLKNYIQSLEFYFDNPELVSEELLKLKMKELILLLAKTDKAEAIKSLINGLFNPSEVDFRSVVEANVYNKLSLEELASLTNLSLSSFKREFVKHYDSSPGKYLKTRKLEKAAKLLKATTLRISDIAFDCGFGDLAHFSKSFQKHFGHSPSEYRQDAIAQG